MDGGSLDSLRHRRFRRLTVAFVVALTLFGLIDVRRRARFDARQPDAHRTDITIFTGAGAAFLNDDHPYEFANPRGWKYAYPPLCALLLAPLAAFSMQTQAVVWYALSCGLGWLAWREAVRISRRLGRDIRFAPENRTRDSRLGWIAAATVALPALNCLQRGQVGILNLWLLLWGFRLLIESATWRGALAAGIVLALPAVIKVTPALPALVVVGAWSVMHWRSGRFALSRGALSGLAVGGILFLLAVPAGVLGWEANLRHLQTWRTSILTMAVEVDPASTVETPFTVRNQSLSNAVYRLGNFVDHALFGGADDRTIDAVPFNPNHNLLMDSARASRLVLALRMLVLALLGAVAWCAAGAKDEGRLAAVFGLACAASLIVSPLSRGHYFVFLLPAVLWGAIADDSRRSSLQLRFLTWSPVVLTVLHYVALDVAGRIGLLGIGLTVWFVVAAVELLRRRPAATVQVHATDLVPRAHAA